MSEFFLDARGVAALVTAGAVVVGGIVGLRRYRHSLRIKAGELLLAMEVEFRHVFPTCLEIEVSASYDERFRPLLKAVAREERPSAEDLERLKALDRCLRFFYLCTVLHTDLKIEQAILARSYYWYARLLIDSERRPELATYVHQNYRRLSAWLHEYLPCFEAYRDSGRWDTRLRDRRWSLDESSDAGDGPSGVDGLVWRPLRNDETGRSLVEALAPDLGEHFRAAMHDWWTGRERPYSLEDWHVFGATDAASGQAAGIFGFYRHPGDEAGRYWLGWLGVVPSMRRRGRASAMVRIVEREIGKLGAGSLWVYADSTDAAAAAFYRSNGFEEAGRFEDLGLPQAAANAGSRVFRKRLERR